MAERACLRRHNFELVCDYVEYSGHTRVQARGAVGDTPIEWRRRIPSMTLAEFVLSDLREHKCDTVTSLHKLGRSDRRF